MKGAGRGIAAMEAKIAARAAEGKMTFTDGPEDGVWTRRSTRSLRRRGWRCGRPRLIVFWQNGPLG